ncbi:MAG TPA: hypothetical protein VJZ27_00755, partial [Aggregatilineales bacterium]|nr:hypothetical protein [Aggregatilineales bacterium]
KQNVRLIPPTGLLGAFMQSSGHEIPFNRIYNIEFRHVKEEISNSVPSDDGNFTVEELTVRHNWGIFLTLPDESLMLLQDTFTQSSDLIHSKVTTAGGTKLDTNAIEGMNYFRRHLQEQEEIDSHHQSVEYATYVIASALNVSVVATEVDI